jgi:hypothetical protein
MFTTTIDPSTNAALRHRADLGREMELMTVDPFARTGHQRSGRALYARTPHPINLCLARWN